MKKFKIALIGAFDMENYGDLLFEDVFEHEIKKRIEVEKILLFAPTECNKAFCTNKKVFSVEDIEKIYLKENFDAIVIGGGDLIHFEKIYTIMPQLQESKIEYKSFYMWIIPILVGIKYNIPIAFNSPGVPIKFINSEYGIVKHLLKAVDYISVRDPLSRENLLETGIEKNKVNVSPDTVLYARHIFKKESLERKLNSLDLGISSKDRYIIFHANATFQDQDLRKCINALFEIKMKYQFKIVILPIGYALGDMEAINKLQKLIPEAVVITEKLSPIETLSVVSSSQCYIGASLHGAITANAYEVPAVAYNYNHFNKIDGYFQLTNQTNCVIYDADNIEKLVSEKIDKIPFTLSQFDNSIEEHFDRIANIISDKFNIYSKNRKKIDGLAIDICEAQYEVRKNNFVYKDILERLSNSEKKNKELWDINKENKKKIEKQDEVYLKLETEYKLIINSRIWKATKGIRKFGDIIKKLKK